MLTDEDKQWIVDSLREFETRMLTFMSGHFDTIEAGIDRHDRNIASFHMSMGSIQTQQAEWERQVRAMLTRIDNLELAVARLGGK